MKIAVDSFPEGCHVGVVGASDLDSVSYREWSLRRNPSSHERVKQTMSSSNSNQVDGNDKPPGWEKVERLQIEAKDLAIQMKPHIREAKKYAVQLAAKLCVAYVEIRKDPILDPAFDKAVRLRKKGGRDFLRAYVYWAIYDDLADEWEALKGIIDQVVAALHVMIRDYLFKPGVIVDDDAVLYQIENTKWGKEGAVDRTGLSACWSQYMNMQQQAAKDAQDELDEKDRVYARHLESQRRSKRKSEAAERDLSEEDYLAQLETERQAEENTLRLRLVGIIEAQLIRSGKQVDFARDALKHGLYFFDEKGDKLYRVSDAERDEMYRCKMALLTDNKIV